MLILISVEITQPNRKKVSIIQWLNALFIKITEEPQYCKNQEDMLVVGGTIIQNTRTENLINEFTHAVLINTKFKNPQMHA